MKRLLGWLACAVVVLGVCQGCATLGFLSYLFGGPGRIDAVYDMKGRGKVLFVVDDVNDVADSDFLIRTVCEQAAAVMAHEGPTRLEVVPASVVLADISKLGDRWTGRNGQQRISAASLGYTRDADWVVYANFANVVFKQGGGYWRSSGEITVVVFDAQTGERLFPVVDYRGEMADGDGYPLVAQCEPVYLAPNGNQARLIAEESLGQNLGRMLAEMFYSHARKEPGADL